MSKNNLTLELSINMRTSSAMSCLTHLSIDNLYYLKRKDYMYILDLYFNSVFEVNKRRVTNDLFIFISKFIRNSNT